MGLLTSIGEVVDVHSLIHASDLAKSGPGIAYFLDLLVDLTTVKPFGQSVSPDPGGCLSAFEDTLRRHK